MIFSLILLPAMLSNCIHISRYHSSFIDLGNVSNHYNPPVAIDGLEIKSYVYLDSKYPFENFFKKLKNGEIHEAFKNIDGTYRPASTDNDAVTELLMAGYVPTLVWVHNGRDSSIEISEKNFKLSYDAQFVEAIPSVDLPKRLERINYRAVGVNVYNTGVIVLVAAVVVAAALFAVSSRSNAGGGVNGGGSKSERVYSEITKTTTIDYNNLLIKPRAISPGETIHGLVFFKLNGGVDLSKVHLEWDIDQI